MKRIFLIINFQLNILFTEAEKEIAEIFSEVLQLDFRGIDINVGFMDLGGDLSSEIRTNLEIKEKNINIRVVIMMKF